MSLYMISFDLENKPATNYEKIENAIKNLGSYTKILNTTYIVILNSTTCEQIKENLKIEASLGPTDKLCVAELHDFASTEPTPKETLILILNKYKIN